jgi:hypothetical protein
MTGETRKIRRTGYFRTFNDDVTLAAVEPNGAALGPDFQAFSTIHALDGVVQMAGYQGIAFAPICEGISDNETVNYRIYAIQKVNPELQRFAGYLTSNDIHRPSGQEVMCLTRLVAAGVFTFAATLTGQSGQWVSDTWLAPDGATLASEPYGTALEGAFGTTNTAYSPADASAMAEIVIPHMGDAWAAYINIWQGSGDADTANVLASLFI